ncbi:HD-GYP domain-containing protein [Angustibacter sp. McL0619]|uniref:HD-GYP domain-containing protein n=1 Tax=Angustibacter sp. McL0619 TaxID=3415676 RepID=UPI003CF19FE7
MKGNEVKGSLRRVRLYVGATVLAAAAAFALSWHVAPPTVDDWAGIIVLSLLCIVSSMTRVRSVYGRTDLGTSSIVLLAAVVLVGTTGAIIVGVASWLPELRRAKPRVWAMNSALFALLGAAAGATFYAFGGTDDRNTWHSTADLLTNLALPLVLANIVMCLLNAGLVAGIVSVSEHAPYREVLSGTLRSGGIAYIGYGLFGLLLVVLWEAAGVGALAAVLVLAPLFVARWAFAQYAEQNAAHERTVAALVQAVEAKDHYTRGHSERVARASVIIARSTGLSQQRTSTLHFAGMLHDVGKLGVPTRVLQKTGALTDEEFATIARHPVRGLEMVREIEFLGEAFEGILHHHERLDGRGYPMGLAGSAIPEFARIIAVADAFDSMTSTRSYRQARSVAEALEELRRCTGTQFDQVFVEALTDGLARTEWVSAAPAPQTAADRLLDHAIREGNGADVPDSRDHDDPGFATEGRRPLDLTETDGGGGPR